MMDVMEKEKPRTIPTVVRGLSDVIGNDKSMIVPKIILGLALINLLFLLTEIAINVFGAMLPL